MLFLIVNSHRSCCCCCCCCTTRDAPGTCSRQQPYALYADLSAQTQMSALAWVKSTRHQNRRTDMDGPGRTLLLGARCIHRVRRPRASIGPTRDLFQAFRGSHPRAARAGWVSALRRGRHLRLDRSAGARQLVFPRRPDPRQPGSGPRPRFDTPHLGSFQASGLPDPGRAVACPPSDATRGGHIVIDLQCPRWTPDRVLIRKVWRRLDRPIGRFPTLFFLAPPLEPQSGPSASVTFPVCFCFLFFFLFV